MTNKDQTNSTPVKQGEQTLTEKAERAGDQDPAALVHSLQVAITQINHNYEVGDELIPTQLLLPMEQARPGTVAEYAQRLLDEPVHRHKLDMHSVAQTYIALLGNYIIAFSLVGSTVYLAASDKLIGAAATAFISLAQMIAAFVKKDSTKKTPDANPQPGSTKRNEGKGPKGRKK